MRRVLAAIAGLALAAPLAAADPEPAAPDRRPWAVGVSAEAQARAFELFGRGNDLLDQGLFGPALELYRQAIAVWDHPAIRYNLAVALINLERTIEAYQELQRALRYPDALEPDVREQAFEYDRLLRAQVVRLTLDCVVTGTRITLDGTDVAVPCPGSATRLVLPGRHHVVATKAGYVTRTLELAPSGGETPTARLELLTGDELAVARRRWPVWKPWAVVGAGAAVGAVGLVFELQAAADFRSYDNAVAILCASHPCATLPAVVGAADRDARRDNHVAIGLFAAAGATLATGAVLLWLDRAITEHYGYDHVPLPSATVGRGGVTLGVAVAF